MRSASMPSVTTLLVPALLLAGGLAASRADACSCARDRPVRFVAGMRNPNPNVVQRLPANAKGVLWEVPQVAGMAVYVSKLEATVLNAVPRPLEAKLFSFRDLTNKRLLPATVTSLEGAKVPSRGTRKWRLAKDKRVRECLFLGKGSCDDATIQKGVVDVDKVIAKTTGLFRIGPRGGFTPGHEYEVTYKNGRDVTTLHVRIDDKPLKALEGTDVVTALDGAAKLADLSKSQGGSCGAAFKGVAQKLKFVVSKDLQPYRDSLLYFTMLGPDEMWHHQTSSCQEILLGRSSMEPVGSESIFAACDPKELQDDLEPKTKYAVFGKFGLLEVEDKLRDTAPIEVTLDPTTDKGCVRD